MELHHQEEGYVLPFKQKARPKIKVDLIYFCFNTILLIISIFLLSITNDYTLLGYRPGRYTPEWGGFCGLMVVAYSTYLWIWTRREHIYVTEYYIEKKPEKELKKLSGTRFKMYNYSKRQKL